VRYLTIGDNPGRVPRLDRNLFAQLVKQRAPSAELVIHLSCADLTLVRFTTELESLRHLSRNILVISGDPPSGDYARSSAPYDLRAIGAIRAFSRRNHGISTNWQEGLETTDYFLGGALNPRALEAQMRRLWTKTAEAGASFCLTQPVFDTETLERLYHATEALRARLKAERGRDCFVMPGVMALTSLRNAQLLRREFGMPISKPLLAELAGLEGRKARRARGRELRREMMRLCRTDLPFPGLYVVPQFHDYADCIEDLRETGWLESKEEAR
jgi:homocysteine S-methyltransferase